MGVNKVKKIIRMVSVLIIMCSILGTLSIALAAPEDVKAFIEQHVTVTENGIMCVDAPGIVNYLSIDGEGLEEPVYVATGGTTVAYESGDLGKIERIVEDYHNSKNVRDSIHSITDGLAIEADTSSAIDMLSGATRYISIGVGLLTVFIMFGMAIFSLLDICYISFPAVRDKCDNAKETGNDFMVKKTSTGEEKFRWITDDALYAIRTATVENGKNPLGIYIKKRIFTYIILAILLYLLVTGNISIIVELALKAVEGIMRVIKGLAS